MHPFKCVSTNVEIARFAMQLRNVLQMRTADEDLMAMRSRDIGLDSLISVDIRSWFLKNFEVSVPVLKIMGNDTMAELADLVAAQVPPSLLPELADIETPASSEKDPAANSGIQPAPALVAQNEETSSSADSNVDGTSPESNGGSTGLSSSSSRESVMSENPQKGLIKIDWSAEVKLPKATKIPSDTVPAARPRVIVLTGASGLLGRHLLSHLLHDLSVAEIVCIAVRRLDERLRSKELPQDARITYFKGDLKEMRLGLSESDAAQIFRRADAIIHSGADTSHLKFYPDIKAANTGSTRELIRLSASRKIPIHFISTVGVALFGNYTSFPEVSVAAHAPPADGSHGYIAAKWASERMLEQLGEERGAGVWIHRPSTIIREGADAEAEAARTDWMNALVAYMRKTGAVPALRNLRGALDLVRVENAVGSILAAVFENRPKSPGGGASYVHQVGDMVLPLDKLKEFVAEETGAAEVDVLPVEEWTARAVAEGLNWGVAALIDSMDDPGQPHYPRMLREGVWPPSEATMQRPSAV